MSDLSIEMMRAAVNSRREKQSKRVTKQTILKKIGDFLSQTDNASLAVEDTFSPDTAKSAIVTRFENAINEVKLSELVGVYSSGDHVYLVKMTDDVTDEDENVENEDETGVEVFATDVENESN